jgi:hypothetical protein
MNCWKTINLSKDYGYHRILFVAMILMCLSFIALYLPLSMVYPSSVLHEDHIVAFFLSMLFIAPVNKLLHAVPYWMAGKKVKVQVSLKYLIFPVINIRTNQAVKKYVLMTSLVMPTICITLPALAASYAMPGYFHYFLIIASYNIGLSITDYIYLNLFIKAPRQCYIEDFNGGFDILIKSHTN